MAGTTSDWRDELGHWLRPFLDRLGHKARRQMCPLYVAGLIGPGDRKSVQPMAERFAPGDYDQLHHFVSAGVWDAALLETELLIQADRLVGGSDAVLVIDDTAMPKKGKHSVGVAAQYASALGKTANCQCAVSVHYVAPKAHHPLDMRLHLPDSRLGDAARLDKAHVHRTFYALSRSVGLRGAHASHGPRLHDFRHRFAVRVLTQWYQASEDAARLLPVLSAYLGHVRVQDTYWYLSAWPELMTQAMSRLEQRWGAAP